MTDSATGELLVGRDQPLARLRQALARSAAGIRQVVVVTGESGIGKTSLVQAATANREPVAWGTCIDDDGAPGYWPWSRALDDLARHLGIVQARELAGDDEPLLATIAPLFGESQTHDVTGRDRLLLMDAVSRWLERVATTTPTVVVLDDLQWADDSSLALLDFVARSPRQVALCVLGLYRERELNASARDRLADLVGRAEHVELRGLDRNSVEALVATVAGVVPPEVVDNLHRRAGGHPVFTRELALLGAIEPEGQSTPGVVRDAIDRRIRRLPQSTQQALEVSALVGNEVYTDVVARVLDASIASVETAFAAASDDGVLISGSGGRLRFAHDLYRETLAASVPAAMRPAWHRDIGAALEARATSGHEVEPAEVARHFASAIAVDGSERAGRWALAAAARERQFLAFVEAAAHLRRWRSAVTDAAAVVDDELLLDVLLAEADALARAGSVVDSRGLLRFAREVAARTGATDRLALVALAVADLGAQFSTRRDEVVGELEQALALVNSPVLEARLTATLARELQHSVATDRPRAQPLSERALQLGREAGDPVTLIACLLARHDVLWTPGTGSARVEIANEIVEVARKIGDDERRAEGLLLLANALLEQGLAGFGVALDECLDINDTLGQPRHRYTAETRRAAIALLRGELDEAADRIEAAAALGERIREPDTANVRMSQRLDLVRARAEPEEMAGFAAEAVAHWTGAPIHAHAVAAGFLAGAGDVDGARRHLAIVLDLGTWRADRSYLWSVLVRELAAAAVALDDVALCEELLVDLTPLSASCGVNGAVVAFAGSHAHVAGMLTNALGGDGQALLEQARATYDRLGAQGWSAEVDRALPPAMHATAAGSAMIKSWCRQGRNWHVAYHGEQATVPHSKGMADLAVLLARPGTDVHVLELFGSPIRSGPAGEMADPQALRAYRQRLTDLDEDAAEADSNHDIARRARIEDERTALVEELGRVSRAKDGARSFASYPAERARKAVAGRLRDAIRRLGPDLPSLAAHLDATIVTGTHCRYRAPSDQPWTVTLTDTAFWSHHGDPRA